MKGNEKVIETLNGLLADELTAINQYIVHAEMDDNWGYAKLKKITFDRSVMEMKHAEKIIERILFLEGKPVVSKLNTIVIGAEVASQLANDREAEMTAIKNYNEAIRAARENGDNATKELLEGILKDEDRHINDIEAKLDQIQQMGLQHFLSMQAE